MLAYHVKAMAQYLPQSAVEMIKSASLTQEFPTDSQASSAASFLAIQYLEKVANTPVDYEVKERVEKAVDLYGISKVASEYAAGMRSLAKQEYLEKAASAFVDTSFKYAEFVDSFTSCEPNLEKSAALARELEVAGYELSPEELAYAGKGLMSKEAAVSGLVARAYAVPLDKAAPFVKLARMLNQAEEGSITEDWGSSIAAQVAEMDKAAGLHSRGFNPYKDFFVKSAADYSVQVSLAGSKVPYEKIVKLGAGRISQAIGKDVADALFKGAANDKQVLETLPLDLQHVLLSLTNRV